MPTVRFIESAENILFEKFSIKILQSAITAKYLLNSYQ